MCDVIWISNGNLLELNIKTHHRFSSWDVKSLLLNTSELRFAQIKILAGPPQAGSRFTFLRKALQPNTNATKSHPGKSKRILECIIYQGPWHEEAGSAGWGATEIRLCKCGAAERLDCVPGRAAAAQSGPTLLEDGDGKRGTGRGGETTTGRQKECFQHLLWWSF